MLIVDMIAHLQRQHEMHLQISVLTSESGNACQPVARHALLDEAIRLQMSLADASLGSAYRRVHVHHRNSL